VSSFVERRKILRVIDAFTPNLVPEMRVVAREVVFREIEILALDGSSHFLGDMSKVLGREYDITFRGSSLRISLKKL
jgi:hypothetical protein